LRERERKREKEREKERERKREKERKIFSKLDPAGEWLRHPPD